MMRYCPIQARHLQESDQAPQWSRLSTGEQKISLPAMLSGNDVESSYQPYTVRCQPGRQLPQEHQRCPQRHDDKDHLDKDIQSASSAPDDGDEQEEQCCDEIERDEHVLSFCCYVFIIAQELLPVYLKFRVPQHAP